MNSTFRNNRSITISQNRYRQFDSNYPSRLSGIISRAEYVESITNINHTPSEPMFTNICTISCLCIPIGIIILIVGATLKHSTLTWLFALVGLMIACSGMMVCCIQILNKKRVDYDTWLAQTVLAESAKYSSRSPIACVWRLQQSTGNDWPLYKIIIELHENNADIMNMNASPTVEGIATSIEPLLNDPQQDTSLPPPYVGMPDSKSSRCGKLSQNLTNDFCSVCWAYSSALIYRSTHP